MRTLIAAAIIFAAAPSAAQDQSPRRLIVFSQELVDSYGRQFPKVCVVTEEPDPANAAAPARCKEHAAFSLGFACVQTLGTPIEADRSEPATKKYEREELARKIARADLGRAPISLNTKEARLILDRIDKVYPSAIVVGTVTRLIDPDSVTAEPAK